MQILKSISVRHLETRDHENIVDYFLNADKDFLTKMGIDISKIPSKLESLNLLSLNFELKVEEKKAFYIIWLLDGRPIGHSNIDKIDFANEAYMHLHIWDPQFRKKGLGIEFLKLTLPYFFETYKLKNLFCEPTAISNAPNMTLKKLGFEFVKSYDTTPGWTSTFHTVNRWVLSKEKFSIITTKS